MAPLGALNQSWVSAEASLPLDCHIVGLYRFDYLSDAPHSSLLTPPKK